MKLDVAILAAFCPFDTSMSTSLVTIAPSRSVSMIPRGPRTGDLYDCKDIYTRRGLRGDEAFPMGDQPAHLVSDTVELVTTPVRAALSESGRPAQDTVTAARQWIKNVGGDIRGVGKNIGIQPLQRVRRIIQ